MKFGTKTIEVATFRRQVSEEELEAMAVENERAAAERAEPESADDAGEARAGRAARTRGRREPEHLAHRDNTFGTPEEDAFRRDFTVNALFYDIATLSVIDYVGGLEDLQARVIRCIGDPDVRFREDPVRMLRAIVLAARLDFTVDPPVLDAIRRLAPEMARSAPARLMEEITNPPLRGGRARLPRAGGRRVAEVDCTRAPPD